MATTACPLPEVAAALGPFIKTRDDVAAIRRNLQAYLQQQLPLDGGTPLAAVRLTAPLDTPLSGTPSGLTGVRKAYWKALQANQAARANYDALRAELDVLKEPPGPGPRPTPAEDVNESYIPLLRQKEKLRRLRVLESAYSSLPPPSTDPPEARLGEPPAPPSTPPPASTLSPRSPHLDTALLSLKQEFLRLQRRVSDQQRRNALARNSLPAPSALDPGAQIAGLQKALQELTGWMEAKLSVIADAEAEAAPVPDPPEPGGTLARNARRADVDEIEAAYERYLRARRRLLQAVSSPHGAGEDGDREPLFPTPRSPRNSSTPFPPAKSPSELLLPSIPALSRLHSRSAALLQQQAHVRRQLGSAEDQTARLLQRLAGESHLVPPGAARGKDWADASREAGAETEEAVLEKVNAGKAWSGKAREAWAGMEGVPEAMKARLVQAET